VTADRRLVVNADDFGLSAGVNAGILDAHRHGIVTSTSLMVRGAAADEAVAAASAHPQLALGLHVDLAEWACEDGRWRPVYEVVDTADATAVAAELTRQLDRFRALTGRAPTHLDSHQHVHRDEPVRSIMGVRARELRIPLRHHGRMRYCGAFYGQSRDGTPNRDAISAAALAEIVAALPEGATELCCHPAAGGVEGLAYGPERLAELEALCDPAVRRAIVDGAVHLVTFRDALRDLPAPPAR
jgi:predicted glycoside hydrolase/deacetylase ChbG (UPF0249 family)